MLVLRADHAVGIGLDPGAEQIFLGAGEIGECLPNEPASHASRGDGGRVIEHDAVRHGLLGDLFGLTVTANVHELSRAIDLGQYVRHRARSLGVENGGSCVGARPRAVVDGRKRCGERVRGHDHVSFTGPEQLDHRRQTITTAIEACGRQREAGARVVTSRSTRRARVELCRLPCSDVGIESRSGGLPARLREGKLGLQDRPLHVGAGRRVPDPGQQRIG